MCSKTASLVLAGVALQAQSPMPVGVVRGNLVSWSGSVQAGQLTVRNSAGLSSCFFDAGTYFEREFQMISASGLAKGDPLEVIADRKPGLSNCYARTVQVVNAHPPLFVPGVRPPLRKSLSPTESFAPRGDFSFGGRVVRKDVALLTVLTRAGEIHVVLRPDTHYAGDGLSLDQASLPVNAHVFVRAGRDVEGALEAYQVIWGRIVAP